MPNSTDPEWLNAQYNNRKLVPDSLILAGVMISAVVFANQLVKVSTGGWKYGLSLYLPFVGVTFNWLAIRLIRRDEKIVRDSDRLR